MRWIAPGGQHHGRSCFRDELLVFVRPVDAAERVLDATGIDVLRLVFVLVVLQAQAVALLEDQQFAGVAVGVREPALLAPGLRHDLDAVGRRDLGFARGSSRQGSGRPVAL